MRTKLSESPLPRFITTLFPGMALQAFDVVWRRGPRVKAVFVHTRRDLRKVWDTLGRLRNPDFRDTPGRDCLGFCHQCFTETWSAERGARMVVDKRYAAIVVFLVPKLSVEIIAHEAFHAGLAVLRRVKRSPDASVVDMDDEELAAYPAGVVTSQVFQIAKAEGWI